VRQHDDIGMHKRGDIGRGPTQTSHRRQRAHANEEESHQTTSESASETIIHEDTGAHPAQEHDQVTSEFTSRSTYVEAAGACGARLRTSSVTFDHVGD
jgi:hypothetical protein